jgi:peptidoglycan/LPS O-acetylase OafA/YrhL
MRGLAAMIVLFSHLVINFYPVLYFSGPDILSVQYPLMNIIASTPLNVLYCGNFAVMVFFLISGYAITYNFFKQKDNNIASSVFRRYFRLTIPVFFSCLIVYILLKLNLLFGVEANQLFLSASLNTYVNCDADFIRMIKFVLYNMYLGSDQAFLYCYNAVLWMIGYLLIGSMLIYSILAIFGKANQKLRLIVYIIFVALSHKSYFLAIVLGMILCDLDINNVLQKMNKIGLFLILLAGIYFSSFRSHDFPLYSILNIDFIDNHFSLGFLPFFYNSIGAFLLFFAIHRLEFLIKILSTKILLYLGKISFSIYLIQDTIIYSLSSYLYILFRNTLNASYNLSFFTTSAITIIATIISSHVFYNLIEIRSINLSKSLYNLISR